MSYSTIDDVRAQVDEKDLIALTDDEGTGAVDEARVERAIDDADEEIDGHVGSRYTVPLATVPKILRAISVDLALYNLYARRKGAVPEFRAERYKQRLRFLEKVAEGRISLGASDPEGNPPQADAPQMSGENPVRIFDRDTMKDF